MVAATYPRHGEVEMCARADGGPRGRPPLGTLVAGLVGLLVVEGDVGHRLACHMSFPPPPAIPFSLVPSLPIPPPLAARPAVSIASGVATAIYFYRHCWPLLLPAAATAARHRL